MKWIKSVKKFLPLIFILLVLGMILYFHLTDYLSFESLKTHRELLLSFSRQHFIWMIAGFMGIYILTTACSLPGVVFLTLAGGFLFGPVWGTCLTVISATLGAFLVFLSVKFALRDWFLRRTTHWIKHMEAGFQKNAFSYLLILRLVPLFPFFLVNIVPALLGVSGRIFFWGTLIGIIPGTFVYTMIGNGLGHIFDAHQTPNLGMIFDPGILLPLLGLALLAGLPVIYKLRRKYAKKNFQT